MERSHSPFPSFLNHLPLKQISAFAGLLAISIISLPGSAEAKSRLAAVQATLNKPDPVQRDEKPLITKKPLEHGLFFMHEGSTCISRDESLCHYSNAPTQQEREANIRAKIINGEGRGLYVIINENLDYTKQGLQARTSEGDIIIINTKTVTDQNSFYDERGKLYADIEGSDKPVHIPSFLIPFTGVSS